MLLLPFRTHYEAGLQALGPLLSDGLSDKGEKSGGMSTFVSVLANKDVVQPFHCCNH